MPIYRPSELLALKLRAKRYLSQRFLIDQNILEKICVAANVQKNETILEIGSGPGALTEKLLQKKATVIGIEKDPELVENLRKRIVSDKLHLYCEDALTFPIETLSGSFKVVANLPFHIETPLLLRLAPFFPKISSLTIVVQKEVGQKILAKTCSSAYGFLSIFLQAYSIPKYCFSIRPSSFFPKPKIQSSVIHMPLHLFPYPFSSKDFFQFLRKAFEKRRKMLRSSLKGLYPLSKVEKEEALTNFLTARAEELTLEEFALFFKKLLGKDENGQ